MGLLTLVSELATATVLAAYGSTMKLEDAELAWDVPFIASAAITLLAILAHTGFASDGAEEKNSARRAAPTATGRSLSPAGRSPRRCAPLLLGRARGCSSAR